MSNLIPGNQKYLTEQDRVFIEKSLDKTLKAPEIQETRKNNGCRSCGFYF